MRFSEEAMHTMHNADLLKTYGNAVKRATSFAPKYTDGVVPTDAAEAYVEGGDGAPFDLDTLRDGRAACHDHWSVCASRFRRCCPCGVYLFLLRNTLICSLL